MSGSHAHLSETRHTGLQAGGLVSSMHRKISQQHVLTGFFAQSLHQPGSTQACNRSAIFKSSRQHASPSRTKAQLKCRKELEIASSYNLGYPAQTTSSAQHAGSLFIALVSAFDPRARSAVQQRRRLARVRLDALDLQLEVPDLRARLAKLGRQARVLVLQRLLGILQPRRQHTCYD